MIQSTVNYVSIITICGKKIFSKNTLTELEGQLPVDQFCRVHRSYIIRIPLIEYISDDIIYIGSFDVPLAKVYSMEFYRRLKVV